MIRSDSRYHCCATCRYFTIDQITGSPRLYCARLGYETQSHYRFDCWDPKDRVRRKMVAHGEKLPVRKEKGS